MACLRRTCPVKPPGVGTARFPKAGIAHGNRVSDHCRRAILHRFRVLGAGILGGGHYLHRNRLRRVTITAQAFGALPGGAIANLYTLSNHRGMQASITNFGAIITDIRTPDRHGVSGGVTLGFERLERYLAGHPFFGAVAGRVANRIAGAAFNLEGRNFALAANNGRNHLHGGLKGFDKQLWEARVSDPDGLELTYRSRDGEEGYPGNLDVKVLYRLTADNALEIHYDAVTDRPTLVNLTNHSYFNLAGSGTIHGHVVRLRAHQYTPANAELIPTGEFREVEGSPFDFLTPRALGERMSQTGLTPSGYDHNFVLDHRGGLPASAVDVFEPISGRTLEVLTNQPGVQLYTANFLPESGIECSGGVRFGRHGGVCLETQNFPDAIHHPNFPSPVLLPGETYRRSTILRFGVA